MRNTTSANQHSFTISGRIKSVHYAIHGLATMLRSQHNAWLHALATVLVFTAGFCFGLGRWEWCGIILAIVSVWIAEALNTALEFLADMACPTEHPEVKKAKDVAAGAVLISVVGSVVIGILVMGPYVAKLMELLE